MGVINSIYLLFNKYILTVFSYKYGIMFGRSVGSPSHGKDLVDFLNATYKMCLKGVM